MVTASAPALLPRRCGHVDTWGSRFSPVDVRQSGTVRNPFSPEAPPCERRVFRLKYPVFSYAPRQRAPRHSNERYTGDNMNIHLGLTPLLSLLAGILILIIPRLLNFIVAIYLILIGLVGLFGTGSLHI